MIRFLDTEETVKMSQIEEIEKYVGLNFPVEYKQHLLLYNGGRCEPNVFSFMENSKITNSCIDWFLAIYGGEYDNLKDYIDIYKIHDKRLPSHMLPIAHDPGGNLICLSCGNQDNGDVYFWNHENEVDYSVEDDNNYSNLYLISRGFNKFIEELKDDLD